MPVGANADHVGLVPGALLDVRQVVVQPDRVLLDECDRRVDRPVHVTRLGAMQLAVVRDRAGDEEKDDADPGQGGPARLADEKR